MSRTQVTETAYRQGANRLVVRFTETQSKRQPDGIDFVRWFCEQCAYWAPSTRRLRRQAALAALKFAAFTNKDVAQRMLEDMNLGAIAYKGSSGNTAKKSTRASKSFLWADWRRVDAYLQVLSKSTMASLLRSWLRAGLATGLRPCEWLGARVESRPQGPETHAKIHLIVKSAKTTHDLGCGLVRTIDITNLPDASRSAVDDMCAAGRGYDKCEFSDLERRAAGALFSACEALFGGKRRYSLYSCRHQFIANQKALKVPVIEIAAMVGHRVDISTDRVYAKKSAAWPLERIVDRPRGVAAEIALVMQRERFGEKAQAAIARAGSPAPKA